MAGIEPAIKRSQVGRVTNCTTLAPPGSHRVLRAGPPSVGPVHPKMAMDRYLYYVDIKDLYVQYADLLLHEWRYLHCLQFFVA